MAHNSNAEQATIEQQLLCQAPLHATVEDVKAALLTAKGDPVDALALLWDIPAPSQTRTDAQEKWHNIREICDSFDQEMSQRLQQKALKAKDSTK